MAAAPSLRSQVLERIRALVTPQEKVEQVRVSEWLTNDLSTPQAIDAALAKLRERLLALLEGGIGSSWNNPPCLTPKTDFENNFRTAETLLKVYRLEVSGWSPDATQPDATHSRDVDDR